MYSFSPKSKSINKFLFEINHQEYPPILWLGAGCSKAAGFPAEEELVVKINEETNNQFNFKSFTDIANNMSHAAVKRVVDEEYSQPRDTTTFDMLAMLIKQSIDSRSISAGDYDPKLNAFPIEMIFTTNWDFLLESSIARFIPNEHFRTYVRGEIDDRNLANIIPENFPKLKIVKLHGDRNYRFLIKEDDLLNFHKDLNEQLIKTFANRMLIIMGYSLKRPVKEKQKLKELFRSCDNLWYINPEELSESASNFYGIKKSNQITGADGFFNNFIQGISNELLGYPYKSYISKQKKDIIKEIEKSSDIHTNIGEVKELVQSMLRKINRQFDCLKVGKVNQICLVYIHDPSAPGGREIKRIIDSDDTLKQKIEGCDEATISISTRVGKSQKQREVEEWHPNLGSKLNSYEKVIIVDSVSFTGNTLNVVRDYLAKKEKRDITQFSAALLILPGKTEDELLANHWEDVIKVKECLGSTVALPWGTTTATRNILKRCDQRPNPFLPESAFGFIPKPWGDMRLFTENEFSSVRLLTFQSHQKTSYHYHLFRSETFIVLENKVTISLWNHYFYLGKHECISIPPGVPHIIIAHDEPCKILEISHGLCEQRHDIIRIEDIYKREKMSDGSDDGYI